jgi:hypothetical protein
MMPQTAQGFNRDLENQTWSTLETCEDCPTLFLSADKRGLSRNAADREQAISALIRSYP